MSAPQLAIVVDAEEEFDWTQPFSRDNQSTASILAQDKVHAIYDALGVVPTYVIDYPIATDEKAVDYLDGMLREGRLEIGTHPHPWVTPPHDEQLSAHNSYLCNLPVDLQRKKIEALHQAIERAFKMTPTIFKAGRYGFGPETAKIIADMGYQVDCSQVPHSNYTGDGGPDYRDISDQPFWIDETKGLLEIPLSVGFFGALASSGPVMAGLFDNALTQGLRLPGMLAASGVMSRSRLTPEGVEADEQCALLKAMVAQGKKVFTLCYHSPSLLPGHTPYVRDDAGLAVFLDRIHTVLTYFRDALGGEFTTLTKIRSNHQ